MALLQITQATNFASSHAIIRESVKNYLAPFIARETKSSHAKAAREGKALGDAARIEKRRTAVREAMKKKGIKPARSLEYAKQIRDAVLERLPADSKAPSAAAIRSDVRAILKELTGSSNNT
jgi:hypothetical protein